MDSETENKAGVNMGSNKVFYFAKMHDFTEEMTLRLFCEHYQDVLDTPDGQSHLNIRSFMKNGWAGVRLVRRRDFETERRARGGGANRSNLTKHT